MLGQKLKHGISCLVIVAAVVLIAGCGASRSKDAALYYQQKEYEKALSVYQEIEGSDPKAITKDKKTAQLYSDTKAEVAKLYHARALEAAGQGGLDSAVDMLKDAQRLDPDNPDIIAALQSAESTAPDKAMSERNWREAIAGLDGAVQADSNNILAMSRRTQARSEKDKGEALFADGMKEYEAGRFSASLSLFEKCKAQDPFHPQIDKALQDASMKMAGARALFEQAEKHFALRDWSAAIASYDKTLEADKSYPGAEARKAEAGEEIKKGEALFADAQAKAAEKKYKASLALFRQCREQTPSHPEAGKAIKAAEENLKAIEKQYQEALASLQKQQTEKGVAALEQLLSETYPYHEAAALSIIDTASKLSASLEEKGSLAAAMVTIQKALRLSGKFTAEDGNAAQSVAQAREKLGSHMGRLANKTYRRTEYEFTVIAKDALSASAREEMLSQAASRAVTERPANLKMKAQEFSKLPPAERNADILAQAAKTPGKFILLMEISGSDVQENRSDVPLQKEYVSHYVTESNPQYWTAKSNVDTELQRYEAAVRQHKSESDERSRQMAQQGGMFGAFLGGLASGLTAPSRDSLTQAEQTLAQTPQTIQKPINAMHYYSEVTLTKKATVDVYARLAGQNLELAENWQAEEVYSEKYFENPKPEIDIPRITLRPPQDRKLTEDAFMRLGPKVAASLMEVKKHLIAKYMAEAEERVKAKDLLPAYESYTNAFFIDPAMAHEKLTGAQAQAQTEVGGLPFDINTLSQKLEAEAAQQPGEKLSPWVGLVTAKNKKQ